METFLELARVNQQRAREVIQGLGIVEAWESAGAEIHLIGSLATGLLMTHRDIDYHIYSDPFVPGGGFKVMAQLATDPGLKRIESNTLMAPVPPNNVWSGTPGMKIRRERPGKSI